MPRLKMLPSAMADLVNVLDCVTRESGRLDIGLRFRRPCSKLAAHPGLHGRARRELRPDIRSFPFDDVAFHSYVIFFRYNEDTFEVVNIIENDRNIGAAAGEAEHIRGGA